MFRTLLKDSIKILSGGSAFLTYHSFIKSFNDDKLTRKIEELQITNENLVDKIILNKFDDKNNEIMNIKMEALKLELNEVNQLGKHELEVIQNINKDDVNALSDMKHHVDNFTREHNKCNEIVDKIVEILNSKNQFLDDSINFIKDSINNWNEMLSTLNIMELGALTHLLSSVFILMCLLSIITIVYSDLLLNYFKLEEKYPRLGKYLKIRKMFQQYYLFINFMLIIITLLAIIFLNIKILL